MSQTPRNLQNLIVVGQGAAGLSAALAAVETASARSIPVKITLIDKAAESEAGGNTRWSPSYMRMASPTQMEASFVSDMKDATKGQCDEAYFTRLAADAPATVKWIAQHDIEFIQPTYYLAKGPPRIQPSGGGPAVIKELTRASRQAGVEFRYGCTAGELVTDKNRICGLTIEQDGTREILPADAVVLACGGFQGNHEMMRSHFGPRSSTMRLISPGSHFNSGDGIRIAAQLGADLPATGTACMPSRLTRAARIRRRWSSYIRMESSSIGTATASSTKAAALCTRHGNGSRATSTSRCLGRVAYAILDARLLEIADYQRAIRSEVPPVRAGSLAELAELIGINAGNLANTVATYNAACTGDAHSFDATRRDGLAAARTLQPPKSNWARAIDVPPFLAYPLVGAIAYTSVALRPTAAPASCATEPRSPACSPRAK